MPSIPTTKTGIPYHHGCEGLASSSNLPWDQTTVNKQPPFHSKPHLKASMSDTGVVAPGGGDTTCMEFRRDEVLAVPVPVRRSALFFLSPFLSSLSFFSSLDPLPALPLVGVVCSALSGVTDFSSSGSISLGSGAPMFLYTEEMLR